MNNMPTNLFDSSWKTEPANEVIPFTPAPAKVETNEPTMSSLDFLNIYINPARTAAGENEVENRKFVARIEDELDDLGVAEKFSVTTSQGAIREVKGYLLTHDQMMLVGMRESKQVRKVVLAKLKELTQSKPMTTLEVLAQITSEMVRVEQQSTATLALANEARDQIQTLGSDIAQLKNLATTGHPLIEGWIEWNDAHNLYAPFIRSPKVWKNFVKSVGIPQAQLTRVGEWYSEGTHNAVQIPCDEARSLAYRIRFEMYKDSKRKDLHRHPLLSSGFQVNEDRL